MGWRKEEVRNRNAENVRSLFFLIYLFFFLCVPRILTRPTCSLFIWRRRLWDHNIPHEKRKFPKKSCLSLARSGSVQFPLRLPSLRCLFSRPSDCAPIELHYIRVSFGDRAESVPYLVLMPLDKKKTVNKKLKFFSCNSSESRVFAILNSIIWFDILSLHSVYKRLSTDPSAQDFSFRESIRPFLQSLSRKKFDLRPFVDIRRSFRSVNAPTGNDPLGES